ncbi:hypothetical protein J4466_02540 [Candidatus Pacearchaeota archaeon]|nr:hypothetical protein [Candidatus Pacearchaeota archaeon]
MHQEITENQQKENVGNRLLSTGYKLSGWYLRLRIIGPIVIAVIGLLIVIFGIYSLITNLEAVKSGQVIILGIILLVLGILVAWLYWWRSKSLVKGRFY